MKARSSHEDSNNDYLKKYRSINDFRNSVERAIIYDEARQAMIVLYHGTGEEEWFIDELIKCFEQLVSYESGVQFISIINSRLKVQTTQWIEAIFLHYSDLLKYKIGVELLKDCIIKNKNTNQATILIEDIFSSFDEFKENDNYFDFFAIILKIYKGNETVKEILDSFDLLSDKSTFNYLSCFARYFPVDEINCLIPYIEDPLKYIENENDINVLNLILLNSNERVAEQLINNLIPNMISFLSHDRYAQITFSMINRSSVRQLCSIYTAFDIILRKKSQQYPSYFDLALLRIIESMSWKRRFEFFNDHPSFFKNYQSKKFINMLKSMELNEENRQ